MPADIDIRGMLTNKIGPLPGWTWGVVAAVAGYAVMQFRARSRTSVDGGALVRDPVTGEFKSAQSQESVDPITGERRTSSYEASGSSPFGAGVGMPMGYPMPYQSPGDVYVNLPGDTQNMNPGQPVRYPPKAGPPAAEGLIGGYWWTPTSVQDAMDLIKPAGLEIPGPPIAPGSPEGRAMWAAVSYARVMASNPQIDWSKDPRTLVGQPIYVPQGLGDWQKNGTMPPNASRTAPAGYNPPAFAPPQLTTVSSG